MFLSRTRLGLRPVFRRRPLWTPVLEPTQTYDLLLDASDTSPTNIIESGGDVSQLSDKSGYDRHMLQALGAKQPPTFLDTVGGLNTITYNGSGIVLRTASPISAAGKVIVVMWKGYGNDTGASGGMILADTAVNNQVIRWRTDNVNGSLSSYDGSAAASFDPATDRKFVPNILAIKFDVNRESFINGEPSPSNPLAFDGTIQFDAIGELRGNASNADGLFCEVVVGPPADRQKLEGYLAWKWGTQASLPIGHPYKGSPPTI